MEEIKPKAKQHTKQPNNKKNIWIATVILILVFIAAAISYVLVNRTDTKKVGPTKFESLSAIIGGNTAASNPSSATSESATNKYGGANGVGILPRLIGNVLSPATTSGMGATTTDGYVVYTLPVYQVSGKTFQTPPTEGQGAGIESDSVTGKTNYKKVIDFFNENHFNKVSGSSGSGIPTNLSKTHTVTMANYDMYESSDVRCVGWLMNVLEKQPNTTITAVGCANKTAYAKAADGLKPFVDAYGTNDTISGLVFGFPAVANGSDGYKNAKIYQEVESKSAPVDRFEVLYYQAPNKKNWTFFDVENGNLSCTDYNTDVLKMAFKGTDCYDEATDKTVTVAL